MKAVILTIPKYLIREKIRNDLSHLSLTNPNTLNNNYIIFLNKRFIYHHLSLIYHRSIINKNGTKSLYINTLYNKKLKL